MLILQEVLILKNFAKTKPIVVEMGFAYNFQDAQNQNIAGKPTFLSFLKIIYTSM